MMQADEIKNIAVELGADLVGIAQAEPITMAKERFLKWLKLGYQGELDYLAKYQAERFDPGNLLSGAKSIISIGVNYYPNDNDIAKTKKPYKVAYYAWGDDYHITLRKILRKLRNGLKRIEPKLNGRICVDTAPFMDVYWAERAGLGWQGKHSNLVTTGYGCFINIGALVIDQPVDKYDEPCLNHCGNCTACIESCPTGAIIEPYILDATKCISYWTIESKVDTFPPDISKKLNGAVFGCDICIAACPFGRFAKLHSAKEYNRHENIELIETGDVAQLSDAEFTEKYDNSPVSRPGQSGIVRNIKQNFKK
ncbi:MAG: tRNA epoxyqueuosine(34) reductase QueG [Candidatus Zixiibacteriota bacterium]